MSKHNFFQDSFNSAIKWIKVRLLNKYVVCDDFVYVDRGGRGEEGGSVFRFIPFPMLLFTRFPIRVGVFTGGEFFRSSNVC